MNVREFLEENQAKMRLGIPITLQDLIDGRGVSAGSYEVLMRELGKVGLEHVSNARFVMEDMNNGQNRIVLLYLKDIREYEDFDLVQFAAKLKRLELAESSLEDRISDATERSSGARQHSVGIDDLGKG